MNIKRIALVCLLVFIVVILAVFWEQTQKKSQVTTQPTPSAPQPLLPSPATTTQPTYQVGPIGKTFPSTLPVYSVTTQPQIKTIASIFSLSLGLTGQPQEIPSNRGAIYIWSNKTNTVVANEESSTITFNGTGQLGGNLGNQLETYYSSADRALSPLRLTNQLIQLTRATPQYFNPAGGDANEVNSPSQATSIQLNYQYTVGGVAIYAGTSTSPSVFVRLNANADVLSFTARVLPSLKKSDHSVPVIPIVDAVQNLLGGGGRLIDLVSGETGDQPYYFDSPPTISNIQDADLAYYYSPAQNQLTPVYAFRGVGKINGKIVNTTTLVSAVK